MEMNVTLQRDILTDCIRKDINFATPKMAAALLSLLLLQGRKRPIYIMIINLFYINVNVCAFLEGSFGRSSLHQ